MHLDMAVPIDVVYSVGCEDYRVGPTCKNVTWPYAWKGSHGKEFFSFLRRFSFGGSLFLEVPKQAITNMATVHLLGQIGIGITERKKNENMVTHY